MAKNVKTELMAELATTANESVNDNKHVKTEPEPKEKDLLSDILDKFTPKNLRTNRK